MSTAGRLFDPDPYDAPGRAEPDDESDGSVPVGAIVARVRPDVSGIDKVFDYLVPAGMVAEVAVGSIVRVALNGRSVAGWVTELGVVPAVGIVPQPISRLSSVGPSADLVDLAGWAAHRWSGRVTALLRTASPPRRVRSLPPSSRPVATGTRERGADAGSGAVPVIGPTVLRIAPNGDLAGVVASLSGAGDTVVITPRAAQAASLAGELRHRGQTTRLHPRDWAAAAGRGGVVVGPRSAVWARVPALAAIVVIDEHDEALQEERNPTWHARDVAIERAARAGVPCWLLSPAPSLAALHAAGDRISTPARSDERAGWPVVEVVDRRGDEPGRGGLFSDRVAELVRAPGVVLAVLNRKGRAIMLACGLCGELVRTEDGERLMVERHGVLVAPATGEERPLLCAVCGATKLKRLRLGVTRAAEELAALAGEPVDELTASAGGQRAAAGTARIAVGTEAALHQLRRADTVVFLDIDQELLASRYRAAEQAMALLIHAARLVGPRTGGGRIVVQTRTPDHRVLRAAVLAAPDQLAAAEREIRASLGWPPFGALAELGGTGAAAFADELRSRPELAILGPRDDGRHLVRAATPAALSEALAATPRPPDRVRIAVDPPRA